MKNYELSYLVSSNISEEEIKALQESVNSLIQKEEGILLETDYPIKKEGFSLLSLKFQTNPEKIQGLDKSLKSDSRIFRHIILIKHPMKEAKKMRKPMKVSPKKTEKSKVELKEIETRLEEILGE
ncbi:MAG: 30S ribosomal protein S6 [Candidatus Paceibacterota bacterium]